MTHRELAPGGQHAKPLTGDSRLHRGLRCAGGTLQCHRNRRNSLTNPSIGLFRPDCRRPSRELSSLLGSCRPGRAALGQLVHERHPGRLEQRAQQLAQFVDEQTAQVDARSVRNRGSSSGRSGPVRSAGIGHHPPLLRSRWRSIGAAGEGGALELAAVGPAGPLVGQALGPFRPAGDGGDSPLGPAGSRR
jgi:hypothetical protein